MQTCTRCKTALPLEEFSFDKRRKNGRKTWCRPCMNASARDWQIKNYNSQKARKKYLKHAYGVTPEWIESKVCAICGSNNNLHVDHDHSCCSGYKSCGRCVRDVLCNKCNWALGCFNENIDILAAAIRYLEVHHDTKRTA